MAERLDPDSIDKGFILKILKFLGLYKNPYVTNLKRRYGFCNQFIENKIILDIPCGMGWGTSLLNGYKKCYGVDISKEAVSKAIQKYKCENIEFSEGNMLNLSSIFPENYFDIIICLEGFEHITFLEGQKFLKESSLVLKKEGLLIMSTPLLREDKFHSGNQYHLCEYKESELVKILLKRNYKIIDKIFLSLLDNSQIIVVVCKNEKD